MTKSLFTVGICTRDRNELVKQSIELLIESCKSHQPLIQLILCDNNDVEKGMSNTDVHSLVARGVEYISEPLMGKSNALRAIISHAQGRWILFLDDDIRVSLGLIDAYLRGIE